MSRPAAPLLLRQLRPLLRAFSCALPPRQRVVGALAGDAGDPEPVSVFRQFSRSFVSPAEHVNEQPKGVGTRLARACGSSAGTRAGSTGGASGIFAQVVGTVIGGWCEF